MGYNKGLLFGHKLTETVAIYNPQRITPWRWNQSQTTQPDPETRTNQTSPEISTNSLALKPESKCQQGPVKEAHPGPETRVKETQFGPETKEYTLPLINSAWKPTNPWAWKPANLWAQNQPIYEHEIQPISGLVQAQRTNSPRFPNLKTFTLKKKTLPLRSSIEALYLFSLDLHLFHCGRVSRTPGILPPNKSLHWGLCDHLFQWRVR